MHMSERDSKSSSEDQVEEQTQYEKIQAKMARDSLQASMHFMLLTHSPEEIIKILECEILYILHD